MFNIDDVVSYVPRITGFQTTSPAMSLVDEGKDKDVTLLAEFSFPPPDERQTIMVVSEQAISNEVHICFCTFVNVNSCF